MEEKKDNPDTVQYGPPIDLSDPVQREMLIQEILAVPLPAIDYYNRGMAYTETGDYKKAIDEFSESLRLNPAHIKSLLMRGNAYFGAGEKDKAKADFDEYLRRKREKRV